MVAVASLMVGEGEVGVTFPLQVAPWVALHENLHHQNPAPYPTDKI